MSATIMMPQQIDTALREMCSDAMNQAVAALAEKYGFDAEEANRFLAVDDLKIVRKRGPATSSPAEKTKTKAKPEKKAAADKPKRGKTGYLLYADEVREEVRAELTGDLPEGEKLKPQDVVKAIATRWKGEDEATRADFNARAKTPVTSDGEDPEEAVAVPVVAVEEVKVVEPVEVSEPAEPKKKEKKEKKEKEDKKKPAKKPVKKLESESEEDDDA